MHCIKPRRAELLVLGPLGSSRICLTKIAHARLPQACTVVLQGGREALSDFTDQETAQLTALLARLIANLDRLTSADTG
jgi:MarR family transcriptional regulator for hemolysin